MKIKKLVSLCLVVTIFSMIFTACGSVDSENNQETNASGNMSAEILLKNASPSTSALSIYYFDGEKTTRRMLYDKEREKQIIDEINALSIKKVESDRITEITASCYGIDIVDAEGYDIWLNYSNGLWLTKDGSIYEAEYDMKKIYDELGALPQEDYLTGALPEEDYLTGALPQEDYFTESGLYMPNAAILGKYDIRYYYKLPEEMSDTRDDVTLSISNVQDNIVTVKITNDSDREFFYGKYYTLQKEIEGVWYQIPVYLSNYGFEDIGLMLQPHSSVEETCDLTMYGKLEPGHYRIEKEKIVADFYQID